MGLLVTWLYVTYAEHECTTKSSIGENGIGAGCGYTSMSTAVLWPNMCATAAAHRLYGATIVKPSTIKKAHTGSNVNDVDKFTGLLSGRPNICAPDVPGWMKIIPAGGWKPSLTTVKGIQA